MSTYADPSKAAVWLDGDAFRAPAGTAIPADIFASALTGWDAFGGVEAGFTVERPQERQTYNVFNKRGAPYRTVKGAETPVVRMKAVDLSKATALTLLTGGSITAANGGYKWVEGDSEFFALIVRVNDGATRKAYYIEKAELSNRPSEVLNDAQLMGWEMEIGPVAPDSGGKPIIPFTDNNPIA